ncbi:hypothetical protein [Sporosarcina phage Lietuvens]|nr:hypothetical protein [Sporosarcina phage Lietuvens]
MTQVKIFTRKEVAQMGVVMIGMAGVFYGLSQAGRVAVGVAMDVWAMFN